jgi:peptidyl-prolyl cis-trans isomerase SurA
MTKPRSLSFLIRGALAGGTVALLPLLASAQAGLSTTTPPAPAALATSGARGVAADHIVALVNGEPITAAQVRQRLARLERPADLSAAQAAQQVLEQLIDERILVQAAREMGVRVDDAAVDAAEAEVARRNGLSMEQLRERLPGAGLTRDSLRAQLRDELTLQRLRERTLASARASEVEVDQALRTLSRPLAPAQTALELAQILIPVSERASPDEEARARAQAESLLQRARRGEDFAALVREVSPAAPASAGGSLGLRRADRYPTLFWEAVREAQRGDVVGPVRSGAGFHILKVLRKYPVDLPDPVVTQTQVRHILLRATDAASQQRASETLQNLRARILRGELSFEQAAREFSQDGSAAAGGDLGWAEPGLFVPEFEQAMDALAPGEISAPVPSRFGVHLIQVLQRREVERSREALREAVRERLRQRAAEDAWAEQLRELRARAYIEYREPPQ